MCSTLINCPNLSLLGYYIPNLDPSIILTDRDLQLDQAFFLEKSKTSASPFANRELQSRGFCYGHSNTSSCHSTYGMDL